MPTRDYLALTAGFLQQFLPGMSPRSHVPDETLLVGASMSTVPHCYKVLSYMIALIHSIVLVSHAAQLHAFVNNDSS